MFQPGETTIDLLRATPWFRAMRFQSCAVNDCRKNSIGAIFYAEDENDTDGEPVCLCQKHFSQVLRNDAVKQPAQAVLDFNG